MASIEFRVKVIKSSDGTTATLAEVDGSIDATTIREFQEVMDKLVERGVKNLILDCSSVKYINSTGLGVLLKYSDTFESLGGHIAFCRVPSKVMLVMEMLGFNALFTIVTDEATALRSFSGKLANQSGASERALRPAASSSIVSTRPRATSMTRTREPVFPLSASCGRCQIALDIPAVGKYRCPRCGTLMAVEDNGRVRFFVSKKSQPIAISLPCQPLAAQHVAELVGKCAAGVGFRAEQASAAAAAVAAAWKNVIERACDSDPVNSFQVLIVASPSALLVKLADCGRPFDFGPGGSIETDPGFAPVRSGMDSVEYRPHPRGGNVLTLMKSAK